MLYFFLIFFTVYSAVNYYLFIRGWQALQGIPAVRGVYLVLFVVAALSYLVSRIFSRVLPMPLHDALTWVGSFWFAYILYVLLFIVFLDLIRLGNHFFNFYPQYVKANYAAVRQIGFFAVFFITSAVIFAGYLNTRSFTVNSIDIEVPKKSSALTELKAVVISDVHLSVINDEKFLGNLVERINELEPDLVLIPGDLVDDRASYLDHKGIGPALRSLNARYGVFASMGNHEFINDGDSSAAFIRRNGVNLLRDEASLIDNNFYVIGRDDSSKMNFTKQHRKTLREITEGLNPDLPAILMDHTPFRLEEAEFNRIDLQVSGHTHHGQLYPLNFITSMIYEVSWGYKKKSSTNFYISSGAGTWGPPVRTGSNSEIVLVNIKFEN